MPDIRYVCLSDTHFGEEDGLLTNLKAAGTEIDPTKPNPVMKQLVECLRRLISKNENEKKPTLILCGDILELALTTTNQAAMVFERLLELIMPSGKELFADIIYLPGNHDHHLWELARETQYVELISRMAPEKILPVPKHTTAMYGKKGSNLVPSYLLTNLVKRCPAVRNFKITTAYPNLGLLSKDGRKTVIFTHGHFIESLYQLMSNFRELVFPESEIPRDLDTIESQNFAWIDFFWSTLGRSGQAGEAIEAIYEKMLDPKQFKKILHSLIANLDKKYNLPGWDRATSAILKFASGKMVDKLSGLEKSRTDRPLSKRAGEGLRAYINIFLKEQILAECRGKMPNDVTFIFGHTHKPFQECMSFKEYPGRVNVYNTGGWIVENKNPEPIHGGAVVLVDEELNTISLRMYNENVSAAKYAVKVEEATRAGKPKSDFYQRISKLVKANNKPWEKFSALAAETVRKRMQNFRDRIGKNV